MTFEAIKASEAKHYRISVVPVVRYEVRVDVSGHDTAILGVYDTVLAANGSASVIGNAAQDGLKTEGSSVIVNWGIHCRLVPDESAPGRWRLLEFPSPPAPWV